MSRKVDVTRVLMESMRPGQYIHINVIIAWAHILNHEESKIRLVKAAESGIEGSKVDEMSPKKLFCTEIMLVCHQILQINNINAIKKSMVFIMFFCFIDP